MEGSEGTHTTKQSSTLMMSRLIRLLSLQPAVDIRCRVIMHGAHHPPPAATSRACSVLYVRQISHPAPEPASTVCVSKQGSSSAAMSTLPSGSFMISHAPIPGSPASAVTNGVRACSSTMQYHKAISCGDGPLHQHNHKETQRNTNCTGNQASLERRHRHIYLTGKAELRSV